MTEGVFMDTFAEFGDDLYYIRKAYLIGDLNYRDNIIHDVEAIIFRMGGSVIVMKEIGGLEGALDEVVGERAIIKIVVPERELKEIMNSSPPKIAVRS